MADQINSTAALLSDNPAPPSNLIKIFDNVINASDCAFLIEKFKRSAHKSTGLSAGGLEPSIKRSLDISLDAHQEWREELAFLHQRTVPYLRRYFREYPNLLFGRVTIGEGAAAQTLSAIELGKLEESDLANIFAANFCAGLINMQHYQSDIGGYPEWHSEIYPADFLALHRVLFWVVYLNDDFDAGETEFLHQAVTVRPRTGTLLVAPAGFSHTHRGNVPKNGDKYIATSWVMFKPVHLEAHAHRV